MPGTIGTVTGFTDRPLGKSVAAASVLQRIGKGGALAAGGGNVLTFSSAAGVSNGSDTTEDTLFTASLPANTLDIVGRQILLEAWGSLSATNAVKTIRMYFGSSIVYIAAIVTPAAVTAGDWSAQLLITKVGVGHNTQIALGSADFRCGYRAQRAAVRGRQRGGYCPDHRENHRAIERRDPEQRILQSVHDRRIQLMKVTGITRIRGAALGVSCREYRRAAKGLWVLQPSARPANPGNGFMAVAVVRPV